MRYTKGRFLNASLDKASRHNERMAIRIAPPEGPEIAFVLVAGLLARRIVCDLREGQQVVTGQRIGIIRFGSRVDVYCPEAYVPMVDSGAADGGRRNRTRRSAGTGAGPPGLRAMSD